MDFSIPARVKAARQLAGITSVEDLAKKIAASGIPHGLGTTTLRTIEQGSRVADKGDLQQIAEACNLPLEWFTADFSRLAEISEDPRSVIAREIAAAVERAAGRRAGNAEDPPAPQAEGRAR